MDCVVKAVTLFSETAVLLRQENDLQREEVQTEMPAG